LEGMNENGNGDLQIHNRSKGVGTYYINQGKTLSELQDHILPTGAQLVFLNEMIP